MHPTPSSPRARRHTLAALRTADPRRAFASLRYRRIRAPFLVGLILLNTILPHPVAAAAPLPPPLPAYAAPAPLAPVPPASVEGIASWYGNPRRYGEPAIAWYTRTSPWGDPVEFYAAAGPELRRLLGDPNPYHEHYPVTITNPATGITIEAVVVDWCGCNTGKREKLIDLSPAAFEALGVPLSRGIQEVEVTLGHRPRLEPLPARGDQFSPATPERPGPASPEISTRSWLAF